MAERDWTFRLIALPDAADRTLAIRANGSVCAAAQADCKHLARTAADFPPDSATVVIRYDFHSDLHASTEGERLSVYLMGRAHRREVCEALRLLLDRGPLPRTYRLRSVPAPAVNWDQFSAACDVVRRICVLPSPLTAELNPLALSHYIQIHSFEPAGEHDDLRLDKVLDRVQEPVLFEVAVEPCDTSPMLTAHTNYLARLKEINQTWDADGEDTGRSSWTHGEAQLTAGATNGSESEVGRWQPKELVFTTTHGKNTRGSCGGSATSNRPPPNGTGTAKDFA